MYHVIINPLAKSGKGMQIWKRMENTLKSRGIAYDVVFSDPAAGQSISTLAREIEEICLKKKEECRILLLGGDGSINGFIQELQHPENVSLGYIPAGSANDFAKAMGIPLDTDRALERILNCKEARLIDLGELTYHAYDSSSLKTLPEFFNQTSRFAISCGIGFDAAICELSMASGKKSLLNLLHLGKLIYVFNALHLITHIDRVPAELYLDDELAASPRDMILTVGMNTRYEGGGFLFCPQAQPDDELLDSCMADNLSLTDILKVLPRIPSGGHTSHKSIHMYQSRSLRVKCQTPLWVHTDGEVMCKATDIEMCCHKYKLKLLL